MPAGLKPSLKGPPRLKPAPPGLSPKSARLNRTVEQCSEPMAGDAPEFLVSSESSFNGSKRTFISQNIQITPAKLAAAMFAIQLVRWVVSTVPNTGYSGVPADNGGAACAAGRLPFRNRQPVQDRQPSIPGSHRANRASVPRSMRFRPQPYKPTRNWRSNRPQALREAEL